MAEQIKGLSVKIGGDNSELRGALQDSSRRVGDFSSKLRTGVTALTKYGAAAAAAGTAAYTAFVIKGLKAVDANAKFRRSIDATDKGLRSLKVISNDVGVEWSVMSKAAEQLNKRLGEALSGTGEAAGALDRLGLSASNLIGMDVDERFAAIGKRVNELGWSTAQAADVLRDFGVRNGEVVNLLNAGEGAFKGARQEVEELGLAISDIDAAKVEAANDSFARIGMIIDSASEKLAVEFAPLIDAVSDQFTDMAKEAGGAGDAMSQAFNSTLSAAAFTADAFDSVGRVFETMADSVIIGLSALAGEIAETIEGIMSMADMVPGVDLSGPLATVRGFAADMDGVTKEAGLNIKRNLEEPLAGSAFMARVQEAQDAAQAAAEAAAGGEGGESTGGVAGALGGSGEDDDFNKQVIESRNEGIWAQFEKEQEMAQQHQDRLTDIARNGIKTRDDWEAASGAQRVSFMAGTMSKMASAFAQGNDKIAKISRDLAIFQVGVSLPAAVMEAVKNAGGLPFGAWAGAATAAEGLVRMQQIKSQSMGAGGSIGSASPGGGSAATQQAQDPATTINRNVYVQTTGDGNNIPRDQLVSELNGALEEGYTLRGIS